MAAVSPIGYFLVTADAQIIGAATTALQGIGPLMSVPVIGSALIFLGAKGVKIANGDAGAMQSLWFDLVKLIVVIGLSTSIANYTTYVLNFFYTTIPTALNAAVGGTGTATGVQSTASTFDMLYNQVNDQVAAVMQAAHWMDFSTRIGAFICGMTCDCLLALMAFVYLMARLLLGIVLVFGPIAIALSLHHQTAPIFSRWFGKVVALICLEAAGIIVLVMVFAIDKNFMATIGPLSSAQSAGLAVPWAGTDGSPAPHVVSNVMNLIGMMIWFGLGAFALFALPSIAYSIGSGVAINSTPVALALMRAAAAMTAGMGAPSIFGGSWGGGTASENLSLEIARAEIEGSDSGTGSQSALPPPPPPSLADGSE